MSIQVVSQSKDLPIISTEPLPKRKKITEQTQFPTAALETKVTLLSKILYMQYLKSNYFLFFIINSAFIGIVTNAIQDKGFSISSAEAFDAKVTAEKMKEWLLKGDHNDLFLQSLFNLWITSVPPTNSKIREAIWTRFSQFTSSSEYTNFWACLYAEEKIPGSNVLSFYLTYYYFIHCWSEVYPTRNSPCIHETSVCGMLVATLLEK